MLPVAWRELADIYLKVKEELSLAQLLFISVQGGCKWSSSRPGRFTVRKRVPRYSLDGPQFLGRLARSLATCEPWTFCCVIGKEAFRRQFNPFRPK
jgi:hypothetical protein